VAASSKHAAVAVGSPQLVPTAKLRALLVCIFPAVTTSNSAAQTADVLCCRTHAWFQPSCSRVGLLLLLLQEGKFILEKANIVKVEVGHSSNQALADAL
jgi:hypothetical protein